MIILGVDPGTNITGFGIVNFNNNSFTRIASGIIKLPSSEPIPDRLEIIYNEICKVINTYHPDEFSIETAFYGKNIQSTMKIGYARGVLLLAAVHNKLNVNEYSPREIKKAVVGAGAASKEQVSFMVKTLLSLKNKKMKFDESDALAAAICHALRINTSTNKRKDWKSFIEAFPDRVIK